ncbi:MAG TPA: amidohydrolase family protein [Thermoanaerobaculia bacterium]|nr:amidohydrolase family protein [Thermoanaerobaculia bacterium]
MHALLLVALLGAAAPSAERPIALTGATIVDVSASGTKTADIRDAVVVIRGNEIIAAGPRRKTKIPADARIIRADGAYIVPGLNDVFAGLNSQAQANAYLYMGVTSIVGSDEPGPRGRRGALMMNAAPSPRVRRLGFIHGLKEGAGGEWTERTTAEVGAQIDEVVAEGAKVLLLHYRLTPAHVRLAVARARELGLATIGELGRTTYTEGIELGIDAFVHTRRYSLELASPELRAAVAKEPFGPARTTYYEYLAAIDPDAPVVKAWAARIAGSRVALIPTLAMSWLDLPQHDNPWKEEIAAILDPAGIHLPADRETGAWKQDPGIPAGSSANLFRVEERFARAGARYLAGSGSSAFGTLPGISLHRELSILTGFGLTPRQALAAATSNVGEVFHWPRVGQVRKGFDADLLVLDADPTRDIANLKKIRMVIKDGSIVDREALRKMPAKQ